MIDTDYLRRIGLSTDQVVLLSDAIRKEHLMIDALLRAGIPGRYIRKILDVTALDEIPDGDTVEILTMRVAEEWSGLLPARIVSSQENLHTI